MALAQVNFFSNCLMRTVTMQAIIPVDKNTISQAPLREKKPFKTLYLLHGIYGNDIDWMIKTRIHEWVEEQNLAVIMPSGDNHFYVDGEVIGEKYGEFIGKELIEITREMFPLSAKKEDTFIAGLSMGGYGAIRNGLKYYDTFGYIAGLSSALIIEMALDSGDSDPEPIGRRSFYEAVFGNLDRLTGSDKDYKALILKLKEAKLNIPKIYLACGTEDFFLKANRDYRDFLIKHDVDIRYEEGPGEHNWVFWDTYIKKVLEWLPLDKAAPVI